ncbi:hypothetical protein SNE40_020848 [Patella caerulea]|uniref:SOCS box domain-containing protein n=1 Tax=Patella caerulea TaxID=87958 RepID=A0AAN8P7X4_PATCE
MFSLHRCIHGTEGWFSHKESDNVLVCVKLLVDTGEDLDLEDSDGKTPIQLAAERGLVTVVIYLAQRGASLDIKQHPTNLLHSLAGSKTKLESDSYDECLQVLITRGLDINQLNSSNESPLYLAVVNDNAGMVKSLITSNCDVNMKVGYELLPILSMLIIGRNVQIAIVEILIKAGCDINGIDKNGVTPLMECLKHRNVGLAKLLIDKGANMNAQDNKGVCVLEYPYDWNTFYNPLASDTVQMLINRGADIHKGGGIVLNKAVGRGDYTTASLLIERGISVNKEDEHGDKPLGLAARNNDIKLVELLTQKGGDVNHQNQQGETALHKSADKVNGRKVTKILLQTGADINLCDNYGSTALMEAAQACNRSGLQCLLEAGADVNKTDAVGNSAIHNLMLGSMFIYRPSRKWINCLKLLLTNKCHGSLDTPNENGETLFEWLLCKDNVDLIWYLVTENCSLGGFDLGGFRDKFKFPDTLMLSKILFESGAPKREIRALIRTSSLNNRQPLAIYKNQMHDFHDFCESRSLKSRCRREIRKCIGSGIRSKITQLGLPPLLQDYIIMKDLIPEKYFTLVMNDKDDD